MARNQGAGQAGDKAGDQSGTGGSVPEATGTEATGTDVTVPGTDGTVAGTDGTASAPEAAVVGADGLARTPWAYGDPLLLEYYDTEWGLPVIDEAGVFERLSLEGFQAGLSWLTILRKRERFREVFAGFDPDAVAAYDEDDIARLLEDPGIIRHRGKIEACIGNARATIALRAEGGLSEFIWSFRPEETPRPLTVAEVPTTAPESVALSKALKKRGFRFVGPTTMYALMEAIGMVDTHLAGSHRRGASGVWPD